MRYGLRYERAAGRTAAGYPERGTVSAAAKEAWKANIRYRMTSLSFLFDSVAPVVALLFAPGLCRSPGRFFSTV
jgi:hypothetical protein